MNPDEFQFRVLLAMPARQQSDIFEHLHLVSAEIFQACNCAEVDAALKRHGPIHVILTAPELNDGCWRSILRNAIHQKNGTEVVVCVDSASVGFWCDVLDQGAYDLLLAPFRPEQVRAVVEYDVGVLSLC